MDLSTLKLKLKVFIFDPMCRSTGPTKTVQIPERLPCVHNMLQELSVTQEYFIIMFFKPVQPPLTGWLWGSEDVICACVCVLLAPSTVGALGGARCPQATWGFSEEEMCTQY